MATQVEGALDRDAHVASTGFEAAFSLDSVRRNIDVPNITTQRIA